MKKNSFVILCDNCKHEFLLNTININEAEIEIKNQHLILSYFVCPNCNKVYRVSLIDNQYQKLKDDLLSVKKRIHSNYNSKDEERARKLNSMIVKKLERIRNYEDSLNNKFNGEFILVNESGYEFIKYLPLLPLP